MRLLWHRRDCRVADNPAVASADGGDRVLPVIVLDPAVARHGSIPRARVLHDALASLDTAYRDRGGRLHVVHGDPAELLPALADRLGADVVAWNRDYSALAQRRDAAVRDALPEGVATDVHDGHVMHPPGSFATNAGDPYQVFTYYHRKWAEREKSEPAGVPDVEVAKIDLSDAAALDGADDAVPSAEALAGGTDADGEDAPSAGAGDALPALGGDLPAPDPPDGDRAAALDGLAAFVDGPIADYDEARDRPDRDGTSRLSHHLRFGTLGVREVWAATEEALDPSSDGPGEAAREGVEAFRRQLAWRDFYAQVLHHNPENTHENHHDEQYPDGIDWRNDAEEFTAWRRGETGYPLVDAGMRQLLEEAWMHNRVRMVAASFLTKDLLIDWRWGYDWFRSRLADHDPANESGGWQWAAGTGTDAQPYFRVFNPASQCADHDPDGAYVRRYVPELAEASTDAIHDWPSLVPDERDREAPAYVEPIVDHAARREEAIATYEAARPDD